MCFLLLLETSTKVCSVAVYKKDLLIGLREENNPGYSHSSQLTVFIKEIIEEQGLSFNDLNGVAVSRGPGSYTGLRIGTSVAKGLCYALDIPLISVDTLQAMAATILEKDIEVLKNNRNILLCPMIDARRMEVYNSVYDINLKQVKPVTADIIDKNSFKEILEDHRVLFFGDGAEKCKKVIGSDNALFIDDILPSAKGMRSLAYSYYLDSHFENTAYFEPFYLKDFVAGKPKVKGLYC